MVGHSVIDAFKYYVFKTLFELVVDGAGGWYVFCYLLIFEFLHLEIIKKTSFF